MKEKIVPTKAGEVVQIDTRYVWEDGRRRYQRTFVDIFTGFQHAVIVDSLEAEATIVAFKEAEQMFPLGSNRQRFGESRRIPSIRGPTRHRSSFYPKVIAQLGWSRGASPRRH